MDDALDLGDSLDVGAGAVQGLDDAGKLARAIR
jgi:hypothetical protein